MTAAFPVQLGALPPNLRRTMRSLRDAPSAMRLVGEAAEGLYFGDKYRDAWMMDDWDTVEFVVPAHETLHNDESAFREVTRNGQIEFQPDAFPFGPTGETLTGRACAGGFADIVVNRAHPSHDLFGRGVEGPFGLSVASKEELLYRAMTAVCRPGGPPDVGGDADLIRWKADHAKRLCTMLTAVDGGVVDCALVYYRDHASHGTGVDEHPSQPANLAETLSALDDGWDAYHENIRSQMEFDTDDSTVLVELVDRAEWIDSLGLPKNRDWRKTAKRQLWALTDQDALGEATSSDRARWTRYEGNIMARPTNGFVSSNPPDRAEIETCAARQGVDRYVLQLAYPSIKHEIAEASHQQQKERQARRPNPGFSR